jgi:hypothetical protein
MLQQTAISTQKQFQWNGNLYSLERIYFPIAFLAIFYKSLAFIANIHDLKLIGVQMSHCIVSENYFSYVFPRIFAICKKLFQISNVKFKINQNFIFCIFFKDELFLRKVTMFSLELRRIGVPNWRLLLDGYQRFGERILPPFSMVED